MKMNVRYTCWGPMGIWVVIDWEKILENIPYNVLEFIYTI